MKIRFLALAFTFVLLGAATASAAVSSGHSAKISSFDFLVDDSGSMTADHATAGQNKMELAKSAMQRINNAIPANASYSGGIHTIAPYAELQPVGAWNKAAFDGKIKGINSEKGMFGRLTPLGSGFNDIGAQCVKSMKTPAAIILFSDGESNEGPDAVASARSLLAANPGLRLHVVSLADTPAGQSTLDAIAKLGSGAVIVSGPTLIKDDAVLNRFMADVFGYGYAAPAMMGDASGAIFFSFNSAELSMEAVNTLSAVAKKIGSNAKVQVGGYTCNIGPEAYNQELSVRRAQAVRSFLVKEGVPAANVQAIGYGTTMKYSKRSLARRADISY